MRIVVKSAPTVEEAINLALAELNKNREEVKIDVLSEGSRGLFGFGAEEARVRVQAGDYAGIDEDTMDIIKDTLENILKKMGIEASVLYQEGESLPDEDAESSPAVYNIEGDELGILIGRRGQTLACLQYIVKIIAANRIQGSLPSVVIDVNGYKQKRQQVLKELAERVAEQVESSGKSFTLEPMPAYERRIIHMALADYPGIRTESVGFGEDRKVSIIPTN
ncbi:MAG: protein jag [Dehalococcoidales bacterium]|jgi:spoIIIJ-associated protein|nr:protein jag [Dehalococcoidales bacterium]